ncbi:unnamed protein product [Camellia sinensis]
MKSKSEKSSRCRRWWRWSFEIEIEIALNLKDESVRMITVHRGLRETRFEGMRIPNKGLQRALTIILGFKIDFEIERENHRNIKFRNRNRERTSKSKSKLKLYHSEMN